MTIATRKYVAMDGNGTPGLSGLFFSDIGPAYLENNNLWGGENIFTQPVILPPGQNNNQAVNVSQLNDAVANVTSGYVTQVALTAQLADYAPLAGATFTGPVILSGPPTVANQAATMGYVEQQTVNGVQVNQNNTFEAGFTQTFLGPVVVETATLAGNPVPLSQFQADVALLAPLASPVFTGTPTTPTPTSPTDNSLQVANTAWTTAFVAANAFNPNNSETWGGTQTFTNPPAITTPATNPTANELVTFNQINGLISTATASMVTPSSTVTWTNPQTFSSTTAFNGTATMSAGVIVPVGSGIQLGPNGGQSGLITPRTGAGPLLREYTAAPGGSWTIADMSGGQHTIMDTRGGTFAGNIMGPDGVGANNYATVGQMGTAIGSALSPYAPLASPIFTGTPQGPQPPTTSQNLAQLATVGYVNTMSLGQFDPTQNYTFTGTDTFANPVTVATATADGHAANLGQVTNAISAASSAITTQLANYLPLTGGALTGNLSATGSNISVGAGGMFQGPITVPNGTNVTFAATGTGNSPGYLTINNSNQMSFTLPTGQTGINVYNSAGVSQGQILTTATGIGTASNNTWTGTNTFANAVTFNNPVTSTATITSSASIAVTGAGNAFTGQMLVPYGNNIQFAPVTTGNTPAAMGTTGNGTLCITLPATGQPLALLNNNGSLSGYVLTTGNGGGLASNNTWSGTNAFTANTTVTTLTASSNVYFNSNVTLSNAGFSLAGGELQLNSTSDIRYTGSDSSQVRVAPFTGSAVRHYGYNPSSVSVVPNLLFSSTSSAVGAFMFPTHTVATANLTQTLTAATHNQTLVVDGAGAGNLTAALTLPALVDTTLPVGYSFEVIVPYNSATNADVVTFTTNLTTDNVYINGAAHTGGTITFSSNTTQYGVALPGAFKVSVKLIAGAWYMFPGSLDPAVPTNLLTSNNTWSGTNSFTQALSASTGVNFVPGTTQASATGNGQLVSFSTANSLQTQQGGLPSFVPGVIYTGSGIVTTSGTAAVSWFATAGTGQTLTLPANFFTVGKTVRIKFAGRIVTAATAGAVSMNGALGSNNFLNNQTAATLTASSTYVMRGEIILTCASTGTSGGFNATVDLDVSSQTVGGSWTNYNGAYAATAFSLNTTISNALTFNSTNSVSGGTVFNIINSTVEILN